MTTWLAAYEAWIDALTQLSSYSSDMHNSRFAPIVVCLTYGVRNSNTPIGTMVYYWKM